MRPSTSNVVPRYLRSPRYRAVGSSFVYAIHFRLDGVSSGKVPQSTDVYCDGGLLMKC